MCGSRWPRKLTRCRSSMCWRWPTWVTWRPSPGRGRRCSACGTCAARSCRSSTLRCCSGSRGRHRRAGCLSPKQEATRPASRSTRRAWSATWPIRPRRPSPTCWWGPRWPGVTSSGSSTCRGYSLRWKGHGSEPGRLRGRCGAGSAEAMVKERMGGAVRGVAVVSMAVVAVIAGAGVLSTWRYDVASARGAIATGDRQDAAITVALTAAFWHERQVMDAYVFEPVPAVMRQVTAQRDEIQQLFAALGTPSTAPEARSLAQAMAAQARLSSTSTQLHGVARTGVASEFAAVVRLEAVAAGVAPPLDRLDGLYVSRAKGTAIRLLAVRLVARAFRREQELTGALGRLSDRDELLAQLRSTSALLGGVAGELRLAARNAAAVTSEQSSAVAQTSATIEELATTAGSIADNVRAVAEVAERAG